MSLDNRTAIVFISHQDEALVADYPDLIFLRVVSAVDIKPSPSGRLEVQMPCMIKFQLTSSASKLIPAIILELRNESVGEVYGELYGKEEVLLATAKRWEALHFRKKAKSVQYAQNPSSQLEGRLTKSPSYESPGYDEESVSDDEMPSFDEEHQPVLSPQSTAVTNTVQPNKRAPSKLRGILLPSRSGWTPAQQISSSGDNTAVLQSRNSGHARSESPEWPPPLESNQKQPKRLISRAQSFSRSSTPITKKFKPPVALPSRAKSLAPSNRLSSPDSVSSGSHGRGTASDQSSSTPASQAIERASAYYNEPVPALISRGGGQSSVSSELLLSKMISNFGVSSRADLMKHPWASSLRYAAGQIFTPTELLTYKANPFGLQGQNPDGLAVQHYTRLRQIFALVGKTCERKNHPKPSHNELIAVMHLMLLGLRKTPSRT